MEPVKRRKQRFFLGLSLILLLIVTGLGMVYRVFDRYGDILLASEDDQLFRLARSVDRSVESYLNRYGTNLIYVTERRGFHTAEETWRTTGDTAELLFRMEENVLAQDDLIQAVLALYAQGTVPPPFYLMPSRRVFIGSRIVTSRQAPSDTRSLQASARASSSTRATV